MSAFRLIKEAFKLRISGKIVAISQIYKRQIFQNAARAFSTFSKKSKKLTAALSIEKALLKISAQNRFKMLNLGLKRLNNHRLDKNCNLIVFNQGLQYLHNILASAVNHRILDAFYMLRYSNAALKTLRIIVKRQISIFQTI